MRLCIVRRATYPQRLWLSHNHHKQQQFAASDWAAREGARREGGLLAWVGEALGVRMKKSRRYSEASG
jgi:hypothetical protein